MLIRPLDRELPRELVSSTVGSMGFGYSTALWTLNMQGLVSPLGYAPTYTGPSTFWVPDNTGVYQNVGGLANSLGQRIPPIAGARFATTEAGGAYLGPELITVAADREMSSDTGFWSKGTGWSITGGVAAQSGAGNYTTFARANILTAGRTYKIRFTVSNFTGGGDKSVYLGGTRTLITSNGVKDITAVSGGTTLTFECGAAGTTISTDDVSLKEVIPITLTTDSGGTALTGLQMVLQPAVTNKVTCRKRNPTDTTNLTKSGDAAATLTVVQDVAALAAAGLANICSSGNVYKLDNSAGVALAIVISNGDTGNTNKHSHVVWARVAAGTARLGNNDATGLTSFTNATYQRVVNENITPSNNFRKWYLDVSAGGVVYFILPSMTETMAATAYPVVDYTDSAAAVTFTATDLSYPNPLPVNNWQMRAKIKVDGTPTTDMWLWSDGTIGCYYRASDSKFYYRGETYGAELLSTAVQQFDSGWSVTGEATVSGGVGRLLSTGALSQLYVSVAPLIIGKTYKLTYTITGTPTGDVKDGNGVTMPKAVGVNTWVFTAPSTSLALTRVAACDISFTDISAKEVKEISTAAISVGNTYDLGIDQTSSGASIGLNQVVTTDATMTADHTPGATLSIGEKGDNTLYFRGRLQQQTNGDLFAFADQSLQGWYKEDV